MTAVLLSHSEIVTELLDIQAERRRLDEKEMGLLALLQKVKKAVKKPIPLTFRKNVITWDGGALPIRGKGYRFLKALYNADKMRRKIATLEQIAWKEDIRKGKIIQQHTFIVMCHDLMKKLRKANCPYQLSFVRSKEKVKVVERKGGKKPVTKRIQSKIIGAKLGIREFPENLTSD